MPENREQVAERDRLLRPLICEVRPTCDAPGVLVHAYEDDGSRPLRSDGGVQGRLTLDQARGVVRSLLLMIHISEAEFHDV